MKRGIVIEDKKGMRSQYSQCFWHEQGRLHRAVGTRPGACTGGAICMKKGFYIDYYNQDRGSLARDRGPKSQFYRHKAGC
jgi:hypothetical protein